ncbi:MAG: AMP-binding protein, partial [Firmicutes bacterium]|nr:AMP-binding protein [Bacillota bacterium]
MSTLTQKLLGNLVTNLYRPIVYDQGVGYSGETLRADIAHVQAALEQMHVVRGERVLLAEVNSYAFIATYTALILYGAVAVPVNPEMPRPELLKVMTRADVAGAIISPRLLPHFTSEHDEALPECLRFVATLPADSTSAYALTLLSYQAMRFQEKVVSPERQSACMSALQVGSSSVKEDDGAILLYTS